MSDQGRDPPAFMVYAANVLARREHRFQNLAARGLTHTMNLELWVNRSLPSEPGKLAAFLGLPVAEITENLPACMSFFAVENGEIVSPELEAYRAYLLDIKKRQSEGGKDGAARKNANREKDGGRKPRARQSLRGGQGNPQGNPSGDLEGDPEGNLKVLSVVQPSVVQSKDLAVAQRIEVTTEDIGNSNQRTAEGG